MTWKNKGGKMRFFFSKPKEMKYIHVQNPCKLVKPCNSSFQNTIKKKKREINLTEYELSARKKKNNIIRVINLNHYGNK